MSQNKLYTLLLILFTLAFAAKAYAALTLGTTSVTSNGSLTLSTSSSTLILPSTNGTNGQALTTNGSGVTSWTTVSGGGVTCSACTIDTIPVFNGTNLVDSHIVDSGGSLAATIGTNQLQVAANGATLGDGNTNGFAFVATDTTAKAVNIGNVDNGTLITISGADAVKTISLDAPNGVFINGVKKYVAFITQSGGNAPVATVLENTLGGTVVWTRDSAGLYLGTLNGAFPTNKTTDDSGFLSVTDGWTFQVNRSGDNTLTLQTFANGANAEDFAQTFSIEIRVYP